LYEQPRHVPRLFCELGKERVVEGANPYRRTVFAFDFFCIGLRNPTFQPVGVGALDDPCGRKELFYPAALARALLRQKRKNAHDQKYCGKNKIPISEQNICKTY
jgi:hypothetical protein